MSDVPTRRPASRAEVDLSHVPGVSSTRTDRTGLGEVLVSARGFEEYAAMFDLVDDDLAGTVLDCPGGAAGFTATALARGVDATAVDLAYAGGPAALAALAERAAAEVERGHEHLLRHADEYVWTSFTDPADHLRARLAAVETFAAGVAAHPERYVAGALPHLPFTDASFDLVLCSHLLFTYDDRFDEAWHLAALVEMARVAARQVRVFPLVSHVDGQRHPGLDRLRDALPERGSPRTCDGWSTSCSRVATRCWCSTSARRAPRRRGRERAPAGLVGISVGGPRGVLPSRAGR